MRGACFRMVCAFLSAILLLLSPLKAREVHADIDGKWRVTSDVTPEGAITSKSEQQVRAMIGKVMVVSPHRFAFDGQTCKTPSYERRVENTLEYFDREWRINAASLPFGPHVTAIDVGCGLNIIYPVDRQRMIIADDGVFLEAVRIGKATPPPSRP